MLQNEFYRVRIADYATSALCDSEVEYYDTPEHIRSFYKRSLTDRNREEAERCLAAMEEYFSGRGPGNIQLQYEEPRPLLSRVKLLGEHFWECGPQKYLFHNFWNCEIDIAMDDMLADAVYLEDSELPENRLIRCVKFQIKRPTGSDGLCKRRRSYLNGPFWGYPHMIERKEPDILTNSLYYPDHSFQTAEEAMEDMEQPHPWDLRRFFLEIHGDG